MDHYDLSFGDLDRSVSFHNVNYEECGEWKCKLMEKFSLDKNKSFKDLLPCTFCPKKIDRFCNINWKLGTAEKLSLASVFLNHISGDDFAVIYSKARQSKQHNIKETNYDRLVRLEKKGMLVTSTVSSTLVPRIWRKGRSFLNQEKIPKGFYDFMRTIRKDIPERKYLAIEKQRQCWRIRRKGKKAQNIFTLKVDGEEVEITSSQKVKQTLASITLWGRILVQTNPQVFLFQNIENGSLVDKNQKIDWKKTKSEIKKIKMEYHQLLRCFQRRCALAIFRRNISIQQVIENSKQHNSDLEYSDSLPFLVKLKKEGEIKKYKRGFKDYGDRIEDLSTEICKLQTIINDIDNELLEKNRKKYCEE